MSDYLGNLAARSLDPVPAVRPRLASRFEPRSPAAAPLAASPAAAEPALVEESVEVRAETPRPRRSRRRVVMAAEPAVIEEPVEVRAETPRPQRSRRRVVMAAEPAEERTVEVRGEEVAIPPVVRPQRGMADREAQPFETSPPGPLSSGAGEGGRSRTVPAVQPVALGQTLRMSPPSPALLERGPGGEVSRADRPVNAQPPGALQPALPAPASSALHPSRDSISRPAPQDSFPLVSREKSPPIAVSPAVPSSPATRQPLEERPVTPPLQPRITVVERSSLPVRAEAPAAEPVIQISIGRIEVRATPPPAQPARPRPATHAAMSLEEYLRRRSRRGDG